MLRYLIQRLGVMIPTLLVISVLVFAIIQAPPGDYLESMISEMQSRGENVDQAKIDALRHTYGLDQPLYIYYVHWFLVECILCF
jgi:peptide/nickel transport system permease protein